MLPMLLNLPPLYPIVDARNGVSPSERIRDLGAAGFPLVRFRGESLDDHECWDDLKRALIASNKNGGWPAICVDDQVDLALLAVQEGLPLWGLHLKRANLLSSDALAGLGSLRLGKSFHGHGEWSLADATCDYACIELEGLSQACSILRNQGITPVAFSGLTMDDAKACFDAGAESLVMEEVATDPTELLWQAQRLRWQARPPIRKGQGVALVGGSGCGKSTLARKLGSLLDLTVKDLDEIIADRAGKSIPRIFAEDGEPTFRRMETEVTCEAFQTPAVLALGGGAWESESIRVAARSSGYAVLWIAENPDRIWNRIAQDPGRPLAQDRKIFLARWRARMPRWMELPMILPLGRTPDQLAITLGECLGA